MSAQRQKPLNLTPSLNIDSAEGIERSLRGRLPWVSGLRSINHAVYLDLPAANLDKNRWFDPESGVTVLCTVPTDQGNPLGDPKETLTVDHSLTLFLRCENLQPNLAG
jgi:hypothetical protein